MNGMFKEDTSRLAVFMRKGSQKNNLFQIFVWSINPKFVQAHHSKAQDKLRVFETTVDPITHITYYTMRDFIVISKLAIRQLHNMA